jgi:hypothetical protein
MNKQDIAKRIAETHVAPGAEHLGFPMHDIDGRSGLFCDGCNAVIYQNNIDAEISFTKPCPFCGGQLLWILRTYQPKCYGSD